MTPLVNAESTEEKVRDKINKHWQDIQKQCRAVDKNNTGQVSQEEMKGEHIVVLTLKVLVTTNDAQWKGMGDVGSARYEPALLPPCPTIRVLSYSN